MTTKKILKATYVCEWIFKIPTGLDLSNLEHWVKYDTLYIETENETLEIKGMELAIDYKHPDSTEIEEFTDYDHFFSDSDEE
jgi:hypothetical protein